MSERELLTLFGFFFGTIWGSFANVVIVRLPKAKSVVFPSSHCVRCEKKIPWYLNIPIFSWLFLGGKCFFCKKSFSFRYPLVEIIMGALFALTFYVYGCSFSTLEYLIFIFGLVTASFIDLDHMILPDELTLSGIVLGVVGALVNPDRSIYDALLGVLLGGGLLLGIAYFYYAIRKIEGMGGGDIKLLGWIGAVCGAQSILFVLLVSSFIGMFCGIFYIIKSKEGLKTGVPFGPYLSAAAIIYILFNGGYLLTFVFPV